MISSLSSHFPLFWNHNLILFRSVWITCGVWEGEFDLSSTWKRRYFCIYFLKWVHNVGSTKVARQLSVMIQMSLRTLLVIMYSEAKTMQVSISHCIVLYPALVRLSTGSLTARSCRSPPPFQVDRQTLILTLDFLSSILWVQNRYKNVASLHYNTKDWHNEKSLSVTKITK